MRRIEAREEPIRVWRRASGVKNLHCQRCTNCHSTASRSETGHPLRQAHYGGSLEHKHEPVKDMTNTAPQSMKPPPRFEELAPIIAGIGLFIALWTMYFLVFFNIRAPRECEINNSCSLLLHLPLWASAIIRYGLWIPVVASYFAFVLTVITTIRRALTTYLITLVAYLSFAVLLELTFSNSPVAWWKLYAICFPVLILVAAALGHLTKQAILRIHRKE
jgi:hypothetical protein